MRGRVLGSTSEILQPDTLVRASFAKEPRFSPQRGPSGVVSPQACLCGVGCCCCCILIGARQRSCRGDASLGNLLQSRSRLHTSSVNSIRSRSGGRSPASTAHYCASATSTQRACCAQRIYVCTWLLSKDEVSKDLPR